MNAPTADSKFGERIRKLNGKAGRDVVILIDEYDKLIIDFIGKGAKALESAMGNREFPRGFRGILKSAKGAKP